MSLPPVLRVRAWICLSEPPLNALQSSMLSYFCTSDVAKGRNEIRMNQIIQKSEGGRRDRAVGCASVVQSCSGAFGLCNDGYGTVWEERGGRAVLV